MTADERWEYSRKLMTRLNRRIVENGSPEGMGLSDIMASDEMAPANDMLSDALLAWESGEIDKKEVDQKAAAYLATWREVANQK